MIDPKMALGIAILILLLLAWIFWPGSGLIAKWNKASANTKRVLIEDALKQLYNSNYKSLDTGLNSLAGALGISTDRATEIVEKLEEMGLIKVRDAKIGLTDVGESYALRVIRVHRVWERYLADETSVHETEWHAKADLKEHRMTMDDTNKLAASIGNPVFDPHGDPIPTDKGELPGFKGVPLNKLEDGAIARVLHIEDEPASIYAQLVAISLYPGMLIRILEISEEKIRFEANGDECVLAPLLAQNVTVKELEDNENVHQDFERLAGLKQGETAKVVGISTACRGQQRRRLMDFGIVPGTDISVEMISAGGDPTAYNILGTNIALRKEQAEHIYISRN